jgi:HopA1 effector protein family
MPTIIDSNKSTDLVFQDLINNIKIDSNFCISHPQYEPTETPEDVVTKLQKMSAEVQHKYLALQLRNFLLGIYYQGDWQRIDLTGQEKNKKIENQKNLESSLFGQLDTNNCGQGYLDYGWMVTGRENNWLVVHKDELTLHLPSDRYFPSEYENAQQGDIIPIKCPANLVEHGYYVAVGNAGTAYNQNSDRTINIYFNFDVEGAIFVNHWLTKKLNAIELPFTFKSLYHPLDYERYDSGVLNIECDRYSEIKPILESIYSEQQAHFSPEIPLFTKFLAPGVSLAEELGGKDSPEDSFGKHRCQILSNALIEAQQTEKESPEQRLKLVHQYFSQENIDCDRPYFTFSSEDNYSIFNF